MNESKINKILERARQYADDNEWEELEEFADNRRDEFLMLCGRICKTLFNSEDDKWEAWATICGSHVFIRSTILCNVTVSLFAGIKINVKDSEIQ